MRVTRPTLLIDEQKCRDNIKFMAEKARKNNLIFRPHFKTHQSEIIAGWFKDEGVELITVSSVAMAKFFIDKGWKDITIAFPFNILEIDDINSFSSEVTLNLLIESTEVINFLKENLIRPINYYIKIDTGYNRTGLSITQVNEIKNIAKFSEDTELLNFKGLLAHFGNTYNASTEEEIRQIYNSSIIEIDKIKSDINKEFDNVLISIGDTPTCSIIEDFNWIDEIRPGNFVFYDTMQYYLGSCSFDQISVAVACPIVAIHKDRNEIVIYGGAVHLSKDFITVNSIKSYGLISELNNMKWHKYFENTFVKSVSQEHGIISIDKKFINKFRIGDLIGVIPIHSCLTANLLKESIIV